MQIALENKLGKTAKAADASKLNGQTASYYAVASTVNSALAQKANIGALGWIDIRLSTGWRITDGRTFQYSRTPFEIGIISGSFCKENSPKPVKGELVATLPAGYRPPSSIVLYSTYLQHNYNFILSPDGKITVSTSNTDAAISGYSLGGGLSVNTTYPIGG